KAGLVDHEHRIVICQVLDDIVPDDVAQGISVPIPATQDRLLPPWAGIASRLRAHPTGLALLISEQTFQEQACIRRHTLLREQRTYPLLDLSKRRRPQRKRLLNRRGPRPRHSNHGCPWIQKPTNKATVMLVGRGRICKVGYLIESYYRSRTIDYDGGQIDVAIFHYDVVSGVWKVFFKDHARGSWKIYGIVHRLASAIDELNTDPERLFVSAKQIPLLQNSNERAKEASGLDGGFGWDWTAKRTSIWTAQRGDR